MSRGSLWDRLRTRRMGLWGRLRRLMGRRGFSLGRLGWCRVYVTSFQLWCFTLDLGACFRQSTHMIYLVNSRYMLANGLRDGVQKMSRDAFSLT